MTYPDGNQVVYDALLNDAKTWEQQQGQLQAVAAKISTLHLSLLQLGPLFSSVYNPYRAVTSKLEKAAEQGASAAGHLAESLRWTVDKYKGTDHGSAHNIQNTPNIEIPHF